MGRACSVCTHPAADAIDAALEARQTASLSGGAVRSLRLSSGPAREMSFMMDYQYIRSHLEKPGTGVRFESGLTRRELTSLERAFNFCFPPDLREFLSLGLPVSTKGAGLVHPSGWVNWRRESKVTILQRLNHPYWGICGDIEHNNFWLESWGEKPSALVDRFERVRGLIDKAPRLIPIFGHRYIPDRPHEIDNPVFSVMQTHIVPYSSNMEDYLKNEFYYCFGLSVDERSFKRPIKVIEFWTEIVELSMPGGYWQRPVPLFK